MKKIFSLMAATLMSAVMFAGDLVAGDNILWIKGDATEVFGEGTNANANKWRDLAYYDGVIYAIAHSQDASGNPRIYKFDAETGSYLGNMDVSAVWGGDIALTSLQILDKGEVIAMGCRVASATSAVPIYYWDSIQGKSHELMRATIANGGKRVEMIHYEGTLANGKIYLAAEQCDKITVIPVVDKAVVTDEISYITLTSGTGYIGFAPRVIDVNGDEITICSSTKAMTYKISDGSCLTWTDLTGTNQEGGNGVGFFEYNNEKYWATVKMGNASAATLANACIQVQTYTGLGRWGASGVVQKYCSAADVLPSAERNTSFTTGLAVRLNEDGYSVWGCSVNQGIIAYRYVAPVDYNITVNTTAAGNFQITSANCTDVLNDGGSFKFDNATKTITLTNCHFTSDNYPLIINQSVNIVLVGENSITSTISATALKFASGDATIGGGGKLTLSCVNTGGADGIYCPGGNLTINECEIYAEGGYGIEGGSTRTLTINPGAKVTAYGPNKGSFTGWGSIVLGEGVKILSPAGAQIIGGTVCDASGATLTTEVVIGAPAPVESVYALNPYAYGVSASATGGSITVNYSLNVDAAEVYAQLYDGDKLVASTPLKGITKGSYTETIDVSAAGLPAGTYTGKIAVVGLAHEFTTYADSTVTFNNRYHATVDANPMSPNFGNIYGACRYSKIGIYRITPDYKYLNTEPEMLGQSSWASVQRGAVAPNGEMWFSTWGDGNSGIYRYDPSVKIDSCTQFFIGERNTKGLITNNGQEVGCSTPGIAIYSAGKDSKLYMIGEDFTDGSTDGSLAIYNIGQEDGSIVTSWDKAPSAHYNTITDKIGTNFAMAATPYGVWICQNRAVGANNAGARSLQFIGNDGVQRYLSTDAGLINGSYGAGIVTNAAFDKLWMVDGSGNIMQFTVAWSVGTENPTPSLTLDATYETPFGAIAQMTFDFAGNIVAVGGTGNTPYANNASVLRLAVFSLPATEAPKTATPVVGFEYEVTSTGFKGAYTVGGEGADFASLYAACDSVNKAVLAGNLAGDIELLIAADLVEPKNIGLINTTDYTVTIRPDKDVDRTVLFTQPTDNDGPSGAFVVGCDMGITFTGIATKNIVIDGFAENGDTRRLTFTTTDGFGSKAGPIVFYGDVTNSVIKNCIVTNTIYHSSTSAYAITLRNEKNTDKCPVGVIIENNKIEVLVADNGQGIYLNGSQAATAKVGAPKNTVVRNNEIIAATRGIFLYGANGLIAEGNTIRVRQHAGGRLSHGIMGSSQTGVITVRGNKFVELTTVNVTSGDYGIQAITASGGASVWMIENNYFGGFNVGAACADKPTKVCGVRMGDSCVVRHNTFVMPALSYTPSTTLLTNAPITLLYYAGTLNYVVENNIFVSHETAANNSLARGTITSNTKNNLYYIVPAESNKAVVMDAAAPAATFADLSDDIKAANISVPVAFDSLYVLTDASMTSAIGVPAIAEITTDIEGNTRNTPKVIPGCYEPKDINQGESTSIEEIGVEGVDVRKVIRDGQIYIIRDNVMYNMQGQIVK